jgi:hypothetical protein
MITNVPPINKDEVIGSLRKKKASKIALTGTKLIN